MKKWGILIVIVVVVAALYFIEFSKIESNNETANSMPTLDELEFDNLGKNWNDFYKVRATIIDGQRADFDIPKNLEQKVGQELELKGAAVFFSPGCKVVGSKIAVNSLFIYPTLGLANACSHLPEVAMRWTIQINLKEDWIISKTDMIDAEVKVKGTFRIDTNKPYEAVFFLDNSKIELLEEKEGQF